MKVVRLLFAALVLAASAGANAAPYEDEVLSIDVPAGFQGPQKQSMGPESLALGFRKPHIGDRATALLISSYDFGPRLTGIPPDKLGDGAEKYLLDFLAGVERQRSSYQATKPARVTLGGKPAARAEWKGVAQGQPMSGTMYCVIVGTRVLYFHAQDFDDAPAGNKVQAIRAIEAVRFK